MIKVSLLYPYKTGGRFDIDYYCNRHMPTALARLGPLCRGMAVEEGISGALPGSPPAFFAMGHLYFDTLDDFRAALGPGPALMIGDVPNYTDVEPTILISEVKLI